MDNEIENKELQQRIKKYIDMIIEKEKCKQKEAITKGLSYDIKCKCKTCKSFC